MSNNICIRRALFSVSNKEGIAIFARNLSGYQPLEIIATSDTWLQIRAENGLPILQASEITGVPGRTQTIHPSIVGGLFMDPANVEPRYQAMLVDYRIEPIDMVVVNLNDFARVAADPNVVLRDEIGKMDIDGLTVMFAAAMNYQRVAVVTSPTQYPAVLQEMQENNGALSIETRWRLAKEAFKLMAEYHRAVYESLYLYDHKGDLLKDLAAAISERTLAGSR